MYGSTFVFIVGSIGYSQVLSSDSEIFTRGTFLTIVGAGILLGSKIYQCIRPFSYSKDYNKRLSSALIGKTEIFVTPVITAVNNQMSLGMVGKVSF